MPGCIVSATTASFRSVEKRRRRVMPVITSTFEKVSDIGVCPGLCLGPPAKAGVRSKRGALHRGHLQDLAVSPLVDPSRRLVRPISLIAEGQATKSFVSPRIVANGGMSYFTERLIHNTRM